MNSKRRTVIAGNWKMNFTPAEATAFINEIKPMVAGKDACDVIFCAPYVTIAAAQAAAAGSNIRIGAENVHFADHGAYTGEVSARMLTECGVQYVIIGHSERRQYFGETDETVNQRTRAALAAGMTVILCLGEVKEQRLAGITREVVSMQTKLDLAGVSAEDMKRVIIGHSERRQYFGETDETVNQRTRAALAAGMTVILCLGEVKEQRLAGITREVVSMQTKLDLAGVSAEDMKRVIIAYEPVWAIGTGLTATPEQADETCGQIRAALAELYGNEVAESTTIQYGGSMNEKNAADLLSKPNVDGGLIGGASLVPAKFTAIVDAAQ